MSTVQALSAPQGLSMPTAKKIFAFASMCVGMFIALIDIQIVSASLRDIGGGLSAGDDETVWVQTSYLIAEIIIIPLSGWLARVMSTRWLFAASAAGFTLMSLLCGWAWNIQSMIAFRALQGLAGGSMIPLVFTTAFAFFQGKQRVIAAATIGGLASLAPTLGPTVGGWITENYNWHWLFFINVVPGIYIAVAVPLLVKVDSADPTLLRGADYLSILLLALSLGCLEYTLEEGPRWGWFDDATLTTTAWVALLCGVAFVIRTLRHPQPVMDLRALQDRTFSLGCYFSFMAGVGIFATIYLTPLYLGSVRGFSALEIGLAVFSTGLFQVMSIPFYSWLANRVDLRWLLMAGLIGFAVSMYSFVPITHDWGADQLLLPQAFRGLAQQFAVAPTVTLTLGSLPPARLKLAELVGYGTSADAYHLTAGPEDGNGARRAMEIAIRQAGVTVDEIDHINAHATSTQVGDKGELAAIKTLFGAHPVAITSTKSATGHLLGAAGGIEAIFTIQALRDQVVPPTLNLHHPDEDAAGMNLVALQARPQKMRYALSNGFGFGGVNASLLLKRWQ